MYKVLFVCTANICRTPMAEYYFDSLVQEEGLEDLISVESTGTWAVNGAPPAELSREVCAENGIDVSNHRSQVLDLDLMKTADLVLCMAAEHKKDLIQIFPHLKDKIFTLKEYANDSQPRNPSVSDPYGQSIEQYRQTYRLITKEIRRIFPAIKEEASRVKRVAM